MGNMSKETKDTILRMLSEDIPGLHIAEALGINTEAVTRVKRKFFIRHGISAHLRGRIIALINDGNTSSRVAEGLGISKEEVLVIREEYNLRPSREIQIKAARKYQANLRDATREGEKYSGVVKSTGRQNLEISFRRFDGADIRRLMKTDQEDKSGGDPAGHEDHGPTPLPIRISDRHSMKLLTLMADIVSLGAVGIITSPLFCEIVGRAKLLATTIREDNDAKEVTS